MIAGRKLLVADDSATIQKIVDLTFSDEGMEVTVASDGDQAMARLEEVDPDVVLADVFMPGRSGYEVCEAIKHHERFHHIPVMLLVGSFEPFDEAEARRVGADDVLTKPFQSIRQLVNRVGALLGGKPAGAEAPTRRLSALGLERSEETSPTAKSNELMSTAEIELTTADTLPLVEQQTQPAESDIYAGENTGAAKETGSALESAESLAPSGFELDQAKAWAEHLASRSEPAARDRETEQPFRVEHMNNISEQRRAAGHADEFDDVLLDLDDFDSLPPMAFGDAILEIEEEAPATSPTPATQEHAWRSGSFSSGAANEGAAHDDRSYETEFASEWAGSPPRQPSRENAAPDQGSASDNESDAASWKIVPRALSAEWSAGKQPSSALDEQPASSENAAGAEPSAPRWERATQAGEILYERRRNVQEGAGANRLSPADIDAIARRVIEQISDKVVREIAWEVVPELAELLIKRRLEEEN